MFNEKNRPQKKKRKQPHFQRAPLPTAPGKYIMFAPREEYENGTFDVDKMMKPPVPYNKDTYKHPSEKISANFLGFMDPLLSMVENDPLEEKEHIFKIGMMIWNSVVFDTVHGNTMMVDMLRRTLRAKQPEFSLVFDQMINRKMSDFGHDQRLIVNYTVIPNEESFILQVEAGEIRD